MGGIKTFSTSAETILPKARADDHPDGKVDDVALERKFAEFSTAISGSCDPPPHLRPQPAPRFQLEPGRQSPILARLARWRQPLDRRAAFQHYTTSGRSYSMPRARAAARDCGSSSGQAVARMRRPMIEGWSVVALALGYVSILFALAWYADRAGRFNRAGDGRPLIYALSLAVYCTSWTFFGSVGLAASTGYNFIPVYLGPILLFVFGWRFLLRIVRLAKSQNITSVADFLAARYGKSQAVAAIVTVIAIAGTLPYIALQLKAVATLGRHAARRAAAAAAQSADRHGLHHRPDDGDLRRPVRHPSHRRHRAPGRPDRCRRRRIAGQARGISGSWLLRPVLRARWRQRPARTRAAECRDPAHLCGGFQRGLLDHRYVPQPRVHPPAAAAVPCDRGREQLGEGDPPRRLAVPGLPGPDQPVRRARSLRPACSTCPRAPTTPTPSCWPYRCRRVPRPSRCWLSSAACRPPPPW